MKSRNFLFALIMLLAAMLTFSEYSYSAEKVRIILKQPPPGMLNIDGMWSFTLINLTNQQQEIYLKGSATEEKDGLIATGQTVAIKLKANETKNIKVSDLPQTPDIEYLAKDGRYKESLIRQGKFPEGNYEICVRVIDKGTNEELGSDCITQSVQGEGTLMLISPPEDEEIDTELPVNFSWASTMKGAKYTLYIADITKNPGQDPTKAKDKFSFDAGSKLTYNLNLGKVTGLENAERLAWWVEASRGGVIVIGGPIVIFPGKKVNCKKLSVVLQPSGNNDCCFKLVITNGNTSPSASPHGFRIKTSTASITSVNTIPSGWSQSPAAVPPAVNTVNWYKSTVPNASIMLADVCFQSSSPTFNVVFEWLGQNKKVVCRDSTKISCSPVQQGDSCLDIRMKDVKCIGDSAGYYIYSYILYVTNPSPVSQSYYLTSSCGNINLASPSSIPPGSSTIGGILASTTNTGSCCISIHKPSGQVCDTVCFTLPPCPPVQSDTCMNIMNMDSVNCIGDSLGNYFYSFTMLINNSGTSSQYFYLTSSCGSISSYYPTTLPPGNNYVSGIISTTSNSGLCCIYLHRPSGAICDSICFKIPPCDQDPPPPTGKCDSLNAYASSDTSSGECCWTISLSHPSNMSGIGSIQFVTTAPSTFQGPQLTTGYQPSWLSQPNSPSSYTVYPLSGTVPGGNLNNFFTFCLTDYLTSPQYLIVNWLSPQDSIVCADTLVLDCDMSCVDIISDSVECDSTDSYIVNYTFNNNSSFSIAGVEYTVLSPPGAVINPTSSSLSPFINPGNTGSTSFTVSGVTAPYTLCVQAKFLSNDTCCWCYDTICVDIEPCPTDPCDSLDATLQGDPYNCCYDLSVVNNFNGNLFTGLELVCMDPGVSFQTWSITTGWASTNVFPSNVVNLVKVPFGNYIPLGSSNNIINFCLSGYTTTPQNILVKWKVGDSVYCYDTVTTPCTPTLDPTDTCSQVVNDTIFCNPDGTFTYNFQIQNNSSYTTTGFQLNPSSPAGVMFSQTDFPGVSINPGALSPPQSIIISGIGENETFCFEIALYRQYQVGGQLYSWCCHSDTICVTTPDCGGTTGGCDLEGSITIPECDTITALGQTYTFNLTFNSPYSGMLQTAIGGQYWHSTAGTMVSAGNNTFPCTYTNTTNLPPGTLVCLTFGVWNMQGLDTCKDTVCFVIPQCPDSISTSCDLQVTGGPQAGDTLCAGDNVTITWTSTGTPGNVNLSLININTWSVYQSIAGNISNTGSYNWTIPSNIPCDSIRKWQFYVENTARTCWNYGPAFYIKCCDSTDCSINIPDTVCVDSLGNMAMTGITASNFPGSGMYSWQLVSDPFNPSNCPGRTGGFSNSPGSIYIYGWNINTPCRFKLKVSRGGCTAEKYVTVVRCN